MKEKRPAGRFFFLKALFLSDLMIYRAFGTIHF
jgi:hypothetical protein